MYAAILQAICCHFLVEVKNCIRRFGDVAIVCLKDRNRSIVAVCTVSCDLRLLIGANYQEVSIASVSRGLFRMRGDKGRNEPG